MEKKEIDLMLINTPENIFYLTGHHSLGHYMYMSFLLFIDGDIKLILRKCELRHTLIYSLLSEDQLIGYDNIDNPTKLTVKTIRKWKLLMIILPEYKVSEIVNRIEAQASSKFSKKIS